ncbi:MAG: hypothetical protein ACLQVY_14855 [Limisphaerales bacterium]
MPFGIHENLELQNLFNDHPWQGQMPTAAEMFFVSLDANFPQDFDADHYPEAYPRYLSYKNNSIEAWMEDGARNPPPHVHHPFLVQGNGFHGGCRYHRGIKELITGHETEACFLELLKKPTWGTSAGNIEYRNNVLADDNQEHLMNVSLWISGKLAFFSCGIYTLLLENLDNIFNTLSLRRISDVEDHFAITHPSRYNTVPHEWEKLHQRIQG